MKRFFALLLAVMLSVAAISCARQPKNRISIPPDEHNGPDRDVEIAEQPEGRPSVEAPEQSFSSVTKVNAVLYYVDEANGRLSPEIRPVIIWNEEDVVVNILHELFKGPKGKGLTSPIDPGTRVNKVEQAENIVTVSLSEAFLNSEDLLLARAMLVNTLTEMEAYKYIKVYIDGRELTADGREDGLVLGLLTRYPAALAELHAAEARITEQTDVRWVNRELFFQDYQAMYLLPEVRTTTVAQNNHVQAIVEELIKGPVVNNEGMFPVLPKGTKLLHSEAVEGVAEGQDGIALYFSSEFKTQFQGGAAQEMTTLASLVYSLTTLTNVNFVKIYYENNRGRFIDLPIYSIPLIRSLTVQDFPDMVGRRIIVYFGDKAGAKLIPEYRAMSRSNLGIARRILQELMTAPIHPEAVRVVPEHIRENAMRIVGIENETVIVDLPSAYFKEVNGSLVRDLYAIVNALTDPLNTQNIRQVQFLIDGNLAESYQGISLAEPFIRNPALIRQ